MGPSFGNQYDNQGFNTESTVIDWDMLQGSNGLQEPGNTPPDLWFNSISSLLPQDGQQNADLVFDPSSFIPDPLPNNDAQELYLPNAYPPSDLLLPPDIISVGGINPPPPAPLPGTVVPDTTPLLASIPTQERHPHPSSISVQLAANLSLSLLDEKNDKVVADESQHGGQLQSDSRKKRGGARKRKADNAMVSAKDSGAPKPKKKHMGKAAEQEAIDSTGTTEADVLEMSRAKPVLPHIPVKPRTSPNKPTLNPSYSQIVKTSFTPRACDPGKLHVTTCDHKTLSISRVTTCDPGKVSGDLPKDWSPT